MTEFFITHLVNKKILFKNLYAIYCALIKFGLNFFLLLQEHGRSIVVSMRIPLIHHVHGLTVRCYVENNLLEYNLIFGLMMKKLKLKLKTQTPINVSLPNSFNMLARYLY